MRRSLFLLFWLIPLIAVGESAESLRVDLRYGAYPSRTNLLDQTLLYAKPLLPWLNGEFGARIAEVAWNFQSLEYKAELELPLASFASLSLRLAHSWYPPNGAGSTHLLFKGNFHFTPFEWLSLYGSAGWYERFVGLSGFTVLPRVWRDTPDHDFAMLAGAEVRFFGPWAFAGTLSTFESINTFNFNNPYLQATLKYGSGDDIGEIFLYTRYRLLLGFGRLDELMVGIGIKLQIGPDSPVGASDT